MDVVVIVGVVVLVARVEASVVKEVDDTEDDTVSILVAMVPVDVGKLEAGSVVDRQPLVSMKRNHGQNRIDSFIIELKIALLFFIR